MTGHGDGLEGFLFSWRVQKKQKTSMMEKESGDKTGQETVGQKPGLRQLDLLTRRRKDLLIKCLTRNNKTQCGDPGRAKDQTDGGKKAPNNSLLSQTEPKI